MNKISYSEIKKAIHVGKEKTYSIELYNEPHNFILGNGIVSSNSHAVSYGHVMYAEAYLRAHHRPEYLSSYANIHASKGTPDKPKIQKALLAMKSGNIIIDLPDINVSPWLFTPYHNSVKYGMVALPNLNKEAYQEIFNNRPYNLNNKVIRNSVNILTHINLVTNNIIMPTFTMFTFPIMLDMINKPYDHNIFKNTMRYKWKESKYKKRTRETYGLYPAINLLTNIIGSKYLYNLDKAYDKLTNFKKYKKRNKKKNKKIRTYKNRDLPIVKMYYMYNIISNIRNIIPKNKLNKTALVTLVKCGCFDNLYNNRNRLLKYAQIACAIDDKNIIPANKENKRYLKVFNDIENLTQEDFIEYEIENLGIPRDIPGIDSSKYDSFLESEVGDKLELPGIINKLERNRATNKKGKIYNRFILKTVECDIICYDFKKKLPPKCKNGSVIIINGTRQQWFTENERTITINNIKEVKNE